MVYLSVRQSCQPFSSSLICLSLRSSSNVYQFADWDWELLSHFYPYTHHFIHPLIHSFIHPSIHPFTNSFTCLSLSRQHIASYSCFWISQTSFQSLHPSIQISDPSTYPSIHWSNHQSNHPPKLHPSIYPPIYPFTNQSIHPSIDWSNHPPTPIHPPPPSTYMSVTERP